MNHQRIARLGAFDVERACLRIGPLAALHARGINAARVDGGSDDVVARLDPKRPAYERRKRCCRTLWARNDGFRRNR